MRIYAGPHLALTVSAAGGLGFIGPGAKPSDLGPKLDLVRALLSSSSHDEQSSTASSPSSDPIKTFAHSLRTTHAFPSDRLPVGVGFQLFDTDLAAAVREVARHKPVAAWLFVPRPGPGGGQRDIGRWTRGLREACGEMMIWVQVGNVRDAIAAVVGGDQEVEEEREEDEKGAGADVLVLQGSDAGGHGMKRGAGWACLVPEVLDRLNQVGKGGVPVFAAGGISDGRGVAGALGVGATGAVMGTRFLAASEAETGKGYREDILRAEDGGRTTVRTTLFDRLVGRLDWPAEVDGRAIVNRSVVESEAGREEAGIQRDFDEAAGREKERGLGTEGRVTRYVGSGVGLVRSVDGAGAIVESARAESRECLTRALSKL